MFYSRIIQEQLIKSYNHVPLKVPMFNVSIVQQPILSSLIKEQPLYISSFIPLKVPTPRDVSISQLAAFDYNIGAKMPKVNQVHLTREYKGIEELEIPALLSITNIVPSKHIIQQPMEDIIKIRARNPIINFIKVKLLLSQHRKRSYQDIYRNLENVRLPQPLSYTIRALQKALPNRSLRIWSRSLRALTSRILAYLFFLLGRGQRRAARKVSLRQLIRAWAHLRDSLRLSLTLYNRHRSLPLLG